MTYSKRLVFWRGGSKRVEGMYLAYLTDDERASNKAKNSSAKSIKRFGSWKRQQFLIVLIALCLPMGVLADDGATASSAPQSAIGNTAVSQAFPAAANQTPATVASSPALSPAATAQATEVQAPDMANSTQASSPATPDTQTAASQQAVNPFAEASQQQQELHAFSAALSQQTTQLQSTEANQAFKSVMQQAMPLTPDQIAQLKYIYSQTQRASEAPPGVPPQPTSTTEVVNLAPGAVPPVVRLSQGFVTSLVFVDATGAPWPIQAYDLGDPSAFNIQWDKTNNILMIQSTDAYTYGNLAVRLAGLPTPVMITLIPGQQVVDYRVDMRIQQLGPQAKIMPTGKGLPGQANPSLLGVLDGVPPQGAQTLHIQGGQAQAWQVGDKVLLRTRLTLLSPGFIAVMSSADGTNAYELQATPTLLVSDNGTLAQLNVQGLNINGQAQ